MKSKLEYRMYGLVPYNISEIQKGIQFGHAVVEYAQKYFNDDDYQQWAKLHKTFIILNGGTTNNGEEPHKHALHSEPYIGSLQNAHLELKKNKIKLATFFEPDLNDTLTSVVFLVDERVFDKKKYPDPNEVYLQTLNGVPVSKRHYDEWVKSIGGKQNLFLREFLSKLRLA
jgi:hypothetical protein